MAIVAAESHVQAVGGKHAVLGVRLKQLSVDEVSCCGAAPKEQVGGPHLCAALYFHSPLLHETHEGSNPCAGSNHNDGLAVLLGKLEVCTKGVNPGKQSPAVLEGVDESRGCSEVHAACAGGVLHEADSDGDAPGGDKRRAADRVVAGRQPLEVSDDLRECHLHAPILQHDLCHRDSCLEHLLFVLFRVCHLKQCLLLGRALAPVSQSSYHLAAWRLGEVWHPCQN
mmetsp:Transcript_25451/g.71178  ORF Transcript_25451/g.71178 Transcript_25451/m.71178 type:complete len:226 (+) Transcript_25451:815-1492(+)